MTFFQFCDELSKRVGESKVILHISTIRDCFYNQGFTIEKTEAVIKQAYKLTEDYSK